MSSNQNVDSVFLAAVEMQSERERSAYLQDVCCADKVLRARVEQLLEAHVGLSFSVVHHDTIGSCKVQTVCVANY